MSGPTHWYRAYGLRIRSAVALPFDPPARFRRLRTGRDRAPRRRSRDPPRLQRPLDRSNRWQARPGAFLMRVEDVARYLVTGGRDMLIDPLGTDDGDVVAFFASSPFTALLQQRGVATLHAASVATEAGAVLLLGRSGIGKSSLAAALVERGYPLLADDVTGVTLDAGGRPVALPAFAHQRLWANTLDEMHWRGRAQSRVQRGLEKYWMPAQRACAVPLPVCAAFVLEANDHPDIGIEPAPPGSAFRLLWKNIHRRRMMSAMGQHLAHFRTVTATARRVPVARMTRPRYPFLLDALADHVEAHLRERAAGGPEPRLPTPVHEETSTSSALAHHHTPGESRQPATRSGKSSST